jgi:AmiR/NasT family two-component response regulator
MKHPGAQERLRIVIAKEEPERHRALTRLVVSLGHEAIAWDSAAGHELQPDVALVGRSGSDEEAFALIATLAHERSCPAVVTIETHDCGYVHAATRAGAFGYVVGLSMEDLDCAMAVAFERYREYRGLQDAVARRAVVEQAKGILMAVHGVGQDAAFDLLRGQARSNSRKLVEVAEAVVQGQPLLVPSWARQSSPFEP